MPNDDFKRTDTVHINEVTRTATGTVQWFLEKAHNRTTHPITHNNKLHIFMGGEEGFADIANQIMVAKESIDICCWGFDPGMELVRGGGSIWPRGDTYGDLLIAAGKRGVNIRLLAWYDCFAIGSANPRNLPGYTHDTSPWRPNGSWSANDAANIGALHSVKTIQSYHDAPLTSARFMREPLVSLKKQAYAATPDLIAMLAREEYCNSWFLAAFKGLLKGIEIRTRCGSADSAATSLKNEPIKLDPTSIERNGMVRGATHHQKPILFDFFHQEGTGAVGYVMGLNSLTEYWDTNAHGIEDERRERGGKKEANECVQGLEADSGFRTLKPYHDYACRIEGRALVDIYNNFIKAWERAVGGGKKQKSELGSRGMPTALLRKAVHGDSTVQIVRTQPDEDDKTIRDITYQALDVASYAARYLYIENQYFQHAEWAQRLLKNREKVIAGWKRGCAKAGKTLEDMPVMYVFIVIPVPERAGMIPRTYDTLATLGQHSGMTGQNTMIDEAKKPKAVSWTAAKRDVVQTANRIEKPDPIMLEERFGLKVCTVMLNTCEYENRRWRYREIYIHSKLMLVDDTFMMLGSANLNLRSMTVDSEINIATVNPQLARGLRKRIWAQHSGTADGKTGTRKEIEAAFYAWKKIMNENKTKKLEFSESASQKKMTGFLLPLEDNRSSTIRLG